MSKEEGRKIIFKCRTGSHLYGTNTPESDEDFVGVFLPSKEDLLGLETCPSEWTFNSKVSSGPRNEAGDVDCKFFSLQKFMILASQGQPGQLEMLFVPENHILVSTDEWKLIMENKELFLSQNGIRPFVGFALSQAYKATMKGENYNLLKSILDWGNRLEETSLREPIMSFLDHVYPFQEGSGKLQIKNTPIVVDLIRNDFGVLLIEVAGRKYDLNLKTKTFLNSVNLLLEKYGTRSKAAAANKYDYKSLLHAFRLLSEAAEYLETGKITFPRPDTDFLKKIKNGQVDMDYFIEITDRLDHIRQTVEPKSPLPKEPNMSKISKLCNSMLENHILGL